MTSFDRTTLNMFRSYNNCYYSSSEPITYGMRYKYKVILRGTIVEVNKIKAHRLKKITKVLNGNPIKNTDDSLA